MKEKQLRNIAIIAHVDHGKTTLVDAMLKQSGVFHAKQKVRERVMDSNDLERERGITILSKNTSIRWQGTKINIVDTPGHADFGGEVERVLKMVNGVLLIVDAFEGPMPQTRFVLNKALALKLVPIVVINKIDRVDARPFQVVDEVLDLFIELGANEEQLDCPVIYASARQGVAGLDPDHLNDDLEVLFHTIIEHIPAPQVSTEGDFKLLITTLDYDDYVGKLLVGRVTSGQVSIGDPAVLIKRDGQREQGKISNLYVFEGLKRVSTERVEAGEIVALTGFSGAGIGETVATGEDPEPLTAIAIDAPTLNMIFRINDSPFAGQDGKYVTSLKLRERLWKEIETNVSLRVQETSTPDAFLVSGRGVLHLSILIENMRREGYELQVSKPQVIYKTIDGKKCEPIEHMVCDVPQVSMGVVMEIAGRRKAQLTQMSNISAERLRLEFDIPARSLIGLRSELLTGTRGEATLSHIFKGYEPYKGDLPKRNRGVLIAFETGVSTTYGLYAAQERGRLFIGANTPVYAGMIVGEHSHDRDIEVNVCRKKHLTSMRASGSEEALRLEPLREFSLEQALEYITEDEYVEVTPQSIRMRKKYLTRAERVRHSKKKS